MDPDASSILASTSVIITNKSESCIDIREFLYQNESDLTLEPITMVTFGFIYSLFVTLGVIGNLLVIISVYQNRSLQSVRNIFIVSLSVSDIVVSIVSGSVTPISAFSKTWLFGANMCYFVPLIQGTSLCFSTLTLTAIAIDRFILIIFPAKKPIQMSMALKMIFLNCSIAASVSFPMFLKQRLSQFQNFCGHFCAEDWGNDLYARSVYGTIVFILQFVIPLIIISFCYLMISLKLKRGMLVRNSKNEELIMTEQRKAALKRRMRTNRMLIGMVGVFFCCWMPSVVFNFLRDYTWLPDYVRHQEYLFGVITHCISMSSTIWNPCLYALMNEQFRIAFVSLLNNLKTTDKKKTRHCSRLMSNTTLLKSHSNTTKNEIGSDYQTNML
ncbi:unnamed protein product [Auanema sp. JU1783]|nr:unnamed protein product [Auanema sp. JU1783]